jgi:CheY-like chemotaxis protein
MEARSSTDASRVSILLIEDEKADTRLVKEAIKELGVSAKVTVVENGYAAMDYLRQNRIWSCSTSTCPACAARRSCA